MGKLFMVRFVKYLGKYLSIGIASIAIAASTATAETPTRQSERSHSIDSWQASMQVRSPDASRRILPPRTVTVAGLLRDRGGTADNLPCGALQIKFIEWIQTGPQQPGQLYYPYRESILATGRGIDERRDDKPDGICRYELKFNYPAGNPAIGYRVPRIYIVRVTGPSFEGEYIYQTRSTLPDSVPIDVTVDRPLLP
jgi:hypothetical protein